MNLLKPIGYTTPRVNCHVNCGLWGIMIYQERFIHCQKKCPTLVKDVDNKGGYASWGQGIYEISVPVAQFFYEPKADLKNKVLFFLKKVCKPFVHVLPVGSKCHLHSLLWDEGASWVSNLFPLPLDTMLHFASVGNWKDTEQWRAFCSDSSLPLSQAPICTQLPQHPGPVEYGSQGSVIRGLSFRTLLCGFVMCS